MKKKYVLGILTVVVLMFGITACGKTTESTPEQNATQEEQKEDHNNVDDTGIDYQADTIYVRFKDTAPAETVGQLAGCK